ncbi:MAG: hypothetical protein V4544_00275 [Pseudomonadota bacterium]
MPTPKAVGLKEISKPDINAKIIIVMLFVSGRSRKVFVFENLKSASNI